MTRRARIVAGVVAVGVIAASAWPAVRAWRQYDGRQHADALVRDRSAAGPGVVTNPEDPARWPAFRGAQRDGVVTGPPLATRWPDGGPPALFRHPIGGGYGGFVVGQGRAFTIEQRGDDEVVAAYDLHTGLELWAHRWPGRFAEALGGDGPRATPTLHEGVVYAYGAQGSLVALDMGTGTVRWSTNPLEALGLENLTWGMAGSPLVVGDRLIVPTSGLDGPAFIAYDVATGEERWVSETFEQGYASPALVTLYGRTQVLHLAKDHVMGLDPVTGDTLWTHPWTSGLMVVAAQPVVVGPNEVWVSSGSDTGSMVVRVGASGVTEVVWRSEAMSGGFCGAVLREGVLYGLDGGVLSAQSAGTGEILWSAGRFGDGQLLLSGDLLVVTGDDGQVALVEARPDRFEERGRMQALEGLSWNVPALADGRLLVRNARQMAAFDLRAP